MTEDGGQMRPTTTAQLRLMKANRPVPAPRRGQSSAFDPRASVMGDADCAASPKARRWPSSARESGECRINNLVTNAGGNGKIGDREVFKVGATVYEVVEAQVNPTSGSDYGSWRLFFINRTLNTIQQLSPVLVGGAQSLGNPTVSFITLPGGGPALVFTCFVFSENAGTTPSGGHMYVYRLN